MGAAPKLVSAVVAVVAPVPPLLMAIVPDRVPASATDEIVVQVNVPLPVVVNT